MQVFMWYQKPAHNQASWLRVFCWAHAIRRLNILFTKTIVFFTISASCLYFTSFFDEKKQSQNEIQIYQTFCMFLRMSATPPNTMGSTRKWFRMQRNKILSLYLRCKKRHFSFCILASNKIHPRWEIPWEAQRAFQYHEDPQFHWV